MGLIKWARRLLGREPARPDTREERVMHLLGPGFKARCGAAWTPAAPLTVEHQHVTCPQCRTIGDHERLAKRATRR